jgi:toxin ParE1/3/4
MPRRKVVITAAAESDLEAIGDYIARDNPRKAAETVLRIIEEIESLDTFPERHPVREHLPEGHRFLIVGTYLVVYRVDEANVYIVRAVHGSRDMTRLFGSDDPAAS